MNKTYEPLPGFYDLRAFDLDKVSFRKLWKIQQFLFQVEAKRQQGFIHPQIDEIRNFSAQYQKVLFSHKIIKPELI